MPYTKMLQEPVTLRLKSRKMAFHQDVVKPFDCARDAVLELRRHGYAYDAQLVLQDGRVIGGDDLQALDKAVGPIFGH